MSATTYFLSPVKKLAGFASLGLVALGLSFASPAGAADAIYWSQNASPTSNSSIARANADGTGINTSAVAVGNTVGGIAYDSTHIYWAGPNGVYRANIDGTGITQLYSGFVAPAIAIDSRYFYAFVPSGGSGGNIIRANLDGTGLNASFIAATDAFYITVDSSHIYWSDGFSQAVGRANIDGTGANPSFISGTPNIRGLAVDGSHVYWAMGAPTNSIGRANLDGTGANNSFVTGVTPLAVAVDSSYLYWTGDTGGPKSIGRANLDGSGVNSSFIATTVTSSVYGLAVGPAGAIPNYALTITKAGTGSGTVTSSPAGVDCGSTCSAEYASGTSVTLTAASASGSTFAGWSGACSGSSTTCTVSMSQAQSVQATFTANPPSNVFTVRTPLVVGTGIRTLVRVPGPGRITQAGTRRSGGKVIGACRSASVTATAAGTFRLRCVLNGATRAARRKGPVRVRLTTIFRPSGGTARAVTRVVVLRSLKPRYTG